MPVTRDGRKVKIKVERGNAVACVGLSEPPTSFRSVSLGIRNWRWQQPHELGVLRNAEEVEAKSYHISL